MDDIKAGIDGAEEVVVDADAEIKRLAALPLLAYERERKRRRNVSAFPASAYWTSW